MWELRRPPNMLDDASRPAAGPVRGSGTLLRSAVTHPSAAEPLARLHLLTGDPDLAAGVVRREFGAVPGDRLRDGELLALLVEAEIARDDVAAADGCAARIDELAGTTEDVTLRARARRCRGAAGARHSTRRPVRRSCVANAGPDPPVEGVRAGRVHAAGGNRPAAGSPNLVTGSPDPPDPEPEEPL
ncbi:MAG: hypothetical protein ACT4RN_08895 [Pseudonocardia sp.]